MLMKTTFAKGILLQTGKSNWDKTMTTKLQKVKHLSAISLKGFSHYFFVRFNALSWSGNDAGCASDASLGQIVPK